MTCFLSELFLKVWFWRGQGSTSDSHCADGGTEGPRQVRGCMWRSFTRLITLTCEEEDDPICAVILVNLLLWKRKINYVLRIGESTQNNICVRVIENQRMSDLAFVMLIVHVFVDSYLHDWETICFMGKYWA